MGSITEGVNTASRALLSAILQRRQFDAQKAQEDREEARKAEERARLAEQAKALTAPVTDEMYMRPPAAPVPGPQGGPLDGLSPQDMVARYQAGPQRSPSAPLPQPADPNQSLDYMSPIDAVRASQTRQPTPTDPEFQRRLIEMMARNGAFGPTASMASSMYGTEMGAQTDVTTQAMRDAAAGERNQATVQGAMLRHLLSQGFTTDEYGQSPLAESQISRNLGASTASDAAAQASRARAGYYDRKPGTTGKTSGGIAEQAREEFLRGYRMLTTKDEVDEDAVQEYLARGAQAFPDLVQQFEVERGSLNPMRMFRGATYPQYQLAPPALPGAGSTLPPSPGITPGTPEIPVNPLDPSKLGF